MPEGMRQKWAAYNTPASVFHGKSYRLLPNPGHLKQIPSPVAS